MKLGTISSHFQVVHLSTILTGHSPSFGFNLGKIALKKNDHTFGVKMSEPKIAQKSPYIMEVDPIRAPRFYII